MAVEVGRQEPLSEVVDLVRKGRPNPARRNVSFVRRIPSASLAPVGTVHYSLIRNVPIVRRMHGIS